MNRQFIKSISIEGFRGINNKGNPLIIDFNKDGITSIFSPNGGGKSSIFDALSYCLNNELKCFKSIEHENQDYKTVRNLFHEGDGKIVIELEDDKLIANKIEFKIDTNGHKEIVSPNKPLAELLINQIMDIHNFLDYNSFTDIINNSPENAGKTFLRLIGYEKFSIIQDKLGKLARNIERDFNINSKKNEINDSQKRIDISIETIVERLSDIGLPSKKFKIKNIIVCCERGIKKIVPEIASENFKNIDIDKLTTSINSKETAYNAIKEDLVKKSQEKELLISYLKKAKLFTAQKYKIANNKLIKAYNVLSNEKDKYLGELFDIAINTYHSFEDIDYNTCLLCNTPNLGKRKNTFVEIIESKIKKYKKFQEHYSDFKDLFIKQLIDTCDLISLENYLISKSKINKNIISEFYYNNEIVSINKFNDANYLGIIKNFQTLLKIEINLLESEINRLKMQIPENLLSIVTKLSNYKTIQTNIKEIEEFENKISSAQNYIHYGEKWANYITTVKDHFIRSNNELMKEIASDISSDTQKYFQEIMMTPEIVPRIEKKDAGQKILMLLQSFYSINERKAASLLSESYRNALCLSIYFACALKNKSKSGFIILDDITSSFDGGHQRYLLKLIKNKISRIYNKKGKQIILFTHDGELEKSLKAFKQESLKWYHYKLHKESNIKVDIKEIIVSQISAELRIKANRGENIGNELRKYLERTLIEIHKQIKIPMTYDLANNRDDRMSHALITNLRNMLKLYRDTRSTRVISSLPIDVDFIDLLNVEKDIANIIAHFETDDTSSYTPAFIVGVINNIDLFNSKFQYNCTCAEVNAGITYYAAVNSKRKGKCKC